MNKIYIGDQEINAGSGSGSQINPSDYVEVSTWNDHEKVIASALVNLKTIEDRIEEFDEKIQIQEDSLLLLVNTVKNDISIHSSDNEKSDKVVAQALMVLNERVTTLENASEGSGSSFDPADINSSIGDLSTRLSLIESDYVASDDLSIFLTDNDVSTFVEEEDVSSYVRNYTYDKSTIDSMAWGSGGEDMTNYYNKSHIDASYGIIDASIKSNQNNIVDLIQGYSELYASVTDLDASALAFDASIRALASSGGGGGGDMSNYATKSDISTFKPIVYTNLSTYEEDVSNGDIDEDAMYVITDLASSDDLATLITIDDLNAEKARINASLNESGDEVITAANSSMNYWKTTNVSQCQSQCNSAKNSAVSAVQSLQSTSVNAVNSAAAARIAEMPTFLVCTESEYNNLSTKDPSTIYFIKEDDV